MKQKSLQLINQLKAFVCRGGRIRTYDLHIPNVARYRATLHPDQGITFVYFLFKWAQVRLFFDLLKFFFIFYLKATNSLVCNHKLQSPTLTISSYSKYITGTCSTLSATIQQHTISPPIHTKPPSKPTPIPTLATSLKTHLTDQSLAECLL